jgi:aspartate carbamoyltransferase catalytic subunit
MRWPSLQIRRSLIDLTDLSGDDLRYVFDRTAEFERTPPGKLLEGVTVVNTFFEESTRTYTSFNLAELRLGADVVNLSPRDLSLAKGETIEDTAIALGAMGVDVLVVRHPEGGFSERLGMIFDGHVVNAGDGTHAHPTQALLDMYTLMTEFDGLENRTVAIVGDIAHSRVAHSLIAGLKRADANLVLVGPPAFLPDEYAGPKVRVERNFDAVLPEADGIVLLRIQRERFETMPLSDEDYIRDYRLDEARLAKVRDDAVILHPGPYNRGMELDDAVLDFAGWRYAKQVRHGVAIRMAVLDFLVHGRR